jgi:hypothetical protein
MWEPILFVVLLGAFLYKLGSVLGLWQRKAVKPAVRKSQPNQGSPDSTASLVPLDRSVSEFSLPASPTGPSAVRVQKEKTKRRSGMKKKWKWQDVALLLVLLILLCMLGASLLEHYGYKWVGFIKKDQVADQAKSKSGESPKPAKKDAPPKPKPETKKEDSFIELPSMLPPKAAKAPKPVPSPTEVEEQPTPVPTPIAKASKYKGGMEFVDYSGSEIPIKAVEIRAPGQEPVTVDVMVLDEDNPSCCIGWSYGNRAHVLVGESEEGYILSSPQDEGKFFRLTFLPNGGQKTDQITEEEFVKDRLKAGDINKND